MTVNTVVVPKAGGVTSTKAIVSRWLKKEGDKIKLGDPLVELETEKINYELESPYEGVLLKILAKETADVPVGDPLCEIGQASDARTHSRRSKP
jgi:pyruvate dehydrogenase E2 component (dihydrolipoamide acetyltransferase)